MLVSYVYMMSSMDNQSGRKAVEIDSQALYRRMIHGMEQELGQGGPVPHEKLFQVLKIAHGQNLAGELGGIMQRLPPERRAWANELFAGWDEERDQEAQTKADAARSLRTAIMGTAGKEADAARHDIRQHIASFPDITSQRAIVGRVIHDAAGKPIGWEDMLAQPAAERALPPTRQQEAIQPPQRPQERSVDAQLVQSWADSGTEIQIRRSSGEMQKAKVSRVLANGETASVTFFDTKTGELKGRQYTVKELVDFQAQQPRERSSVERSSAAKRAEKWLLSGEEILIKRSSGEVQKAKVSRLFDGGNTVEVAFADTKTGKMATRIYGVDELVGFQQEQPKAPASLFKRLLGRP